MIATIAPTALALAFSGATAAASRVGTVPVRGLGGWRSRSIARAQPAAV
jgi:hypothetical protein